MPDTQTTKDATTDLKNPSQQNNASKDRDDKKDAVSTESAKSKNKAPYPDDEQIDLLTFSRVCALSRTDFYAFWRFAQTNKQGRRALSAWQNSLHDFLKRPV